MARTPAELLDQLEKFVPPQFAELEPLLAGTAGSMALAETAFDTLKTLATVEGGTDKWLTMQAHGYGILRATGESDASIRERLRTIEPKVTKTAIEERVNALIEPDTCTVIEWWEGFYCDVDFWLDNPEPYLSGGPNSFVVIIPKQGSYFSFGSFCDVNFWLDTPEAYIGDGPEDPVYAAIVSEIERIRAAGVFWRLVLLVEG